MIEFGNVLKYEKTKVYGDTSTFSFRYMGNQTLEYSEEIKLTFFCSFQFTDFPFDSHKCPLKYGDKIYDTENLNFNSSHIIHGNKSIRFGDRWFSVTRFDYNRA